MLARHKNSVTQPQSVEFLEQFGTNLAQWFSDPFAPRPGLEPRTCGLIWALTNCFY